MVNISNASAETTHMSVIVHNSTLGADDLIFAKLACLHLNVSETATCLCYGDKSYLIFTCMLSSKVTPPKSRER